MTEQTSRPVVDQFRLENLESLSLSRLVVAIEMIADAMKKNDVSRIKVGDFEMSAESPY